MNVFMSEKIKTSLNFLQCEVSNTLFKAIAIIEEDGAKLKAVMDGELPNTYLRSIRIRILHQKNDLIELKELISSVIQKERSSIN